MAVTYDVVVTKTQRWVVSVRAGSEVAAKTRAIEVLRGEDGSLHDDISIPELTDEELVAETQRAY